MLVNVGFDGTSAPNTVQFQFYSAAGVMVGPRVTSAPQAGYPNTVVASYAQVTALAGDGFVVTAYTTGINPEVRTWTYTAAGVATSGWVLVTNTDNGAALTSTVALPGGGFYVSWWDNHLESNVITLPVYGKEFEGSDVFAKRYSATAEELDNKYHLIGQPFEGFANQQYAGYSAVLADGTAVTPVFNFSQSVTCGQTGGSCDGANEIYVSLTTRSGPVTPPSILVAGGFKANGSARVDRQQLFSGCRGACRRRVRGDLRAQTLYLSGGCSNLCGRYNRGRVGFAMAYPFWSSVTAQTGTFGVAVLEASATGSVTDNVVVNPAALTGGQDDSIMGLTAGTDGKVYLTLNNFPGTSGGADQTLKIKLD